MGELWGFLWLLLQKNTTPKDDRYIAKSLKNAFIDLKRKEKRNSIFEPFDVDISEEFHSNIEFFELLKPLTDKEKRTLEMLFLYGFTERDISEINCVSRQTVNKNKSRALLKVRNYVKTNGIDL